MKLTQKQVEAKRKITPAGYEYDLKYALIHGEHTARRIIEISDKEYIEARLFYMEEYETKTNEWGCRWNVPTGRQVPNVHISLWHKKEGCATSNGLGVWSEIGAPQKSKSYKALMACALEDAEILRLAADRFHILQDAAIVA